MTRFRFAPFALRSSVFSVLAVILALSLATPAIAHHKEGHEQGKQDESADAEQSSSGSTTTSSAGSSNSSDDSTKRGCGQAGANDGDAYDSTCDGSPGRQGGDKEDSSHAAGGVGAADNKNPPGQSPDASDHNKGYECDENQGVAHGNPAHSRCRQPATQEVCVPTAANNFCQPPKPPKKPEEPEVLKKFVRKHPPTAPPVTPPEVAGRRSSQLPTTGFESGHALWIALLLMVLGACLTMVVEEGESGVRLNS